MKIKVYAQLSIDEKQIRRYLRKAIVCGPIKRGDIYNDINHRFNSIAIIDGRFDQTLAVSPSEIQDGIRSGLRIYGSSSMGALRAAELNSFGMIGVGKIFDYIKNSLLFRDDFVGQVFSENNKYLKSYSYIDFFFSAKKLVKEKKIDSESARLLCRIYSNLYYTERNRLGLLQKIQTYKDCTKLTKSAEIVFKCNYSQKKTDALELLKKIQKDCIEIKNVNNLILKNKLESKDPNSFYPRELFKNF